VGYQNYIPETMHPDAEFVEDIVVRSQNIEAPRGSILDDEDDGLELDVDINDDVDIDLNEDTIPISTNQHVEQENILDMDVKLILSPRRRRSSSIRTSYSNTSPLDIEPIDLTNDEDEDDEALINGADAAEIDCNNDVSLSPDLTAMSAHATRLHSITNMDSNVVLPVVDLTDDDDDLLGIHVNGIDDHDVDLSNDLNIDTVPVDELFANPVRYNVDRHKRSHKRQRQTKLHLRKVDDCNKTHLSECDYF